MIVTAYDPFDVSLKVFCTQLAPLDKYIFVFEHRTKIGKKTKNKTQKIVNPQSRLVFRLSDDNHKHFLKKSVHTNDGSMLHLFKEPAFALKHTHKTFSYPT